PWAMVLVAISPIGFPELKFPQTVTDPEKTAASESQIRKQNKYTHVHTQYLTFPHPSRFSPLSASRFCNP
ncbi:MAG: hypothetical protein ACK5AN_13685, partial [Planctomyces sp.]